MSFPEAPTAQLTARILHSVYPQNAAVATSGEEEAIISPEANLQRQVELQRPRPRADLQVAVRSARGVLKGGWTLPESGEAS